MESGYRGITNLIGLQQIEMQRAFGGSGVHYFTYFHLPDEFLYLLGTGPFRDAD